MTRSAIRHAAGFGVLLWQLVLLQPGLGAPSVSGSRSEWNQSQASSSNNYGTISSSVQRIEDALNNANQTLSQSECYDFQSRLHSLKQSALLELSRGADASVLSNPIHSLETELLSRIRENSQHSGARKSQLELSIGHLESTFRSRQDELSVDDQARFRERVNELKKQSQESPANTDELFCERLGREARDLESKIMDKVMFGAARYSLHVTKDEKLVGVEKPSGGEGHSGTEAGPRKLIERRSSEPEVQPGQSVSNVAPHKIVKPYVPIPKLIERIEADLMDFHDKNQIGTFDMDSFSERLLAQKRNLKVMMSRNGRVSLRQEAVLRDNLENLHEELINRVTGRD